MFRGPAQRTSETAESVESILGRGARVRGRVGGDGDLRIEGQVEGDVRISGQLSIEEGGAVTGDVEASAVVIGGALTGDVAARGAVTVRAGARVEGNLGGAEIVLEEGASYEGRIEAEFDLPPELTGASHEVPVTTGSQATPTAPRQRGR
jgi:cytoskeletal protein CcmA (bactofilin family)